MRDWHSQSGMTVAKGVDMNATASYYRERPQDTGNDCAHKEKVTTLPTGERVCVVCACEYYQGLLTVACKLQNRN